MMFREKSDSFVNKSLILRVNVLPNMRILLYFNIIDSNNFSVSTNSYLAYIR